MEKPTHLTCPFCPAQSFPKAEFVLRTSDMGRMLMTRYECPAKHCFYIQEKEEKVNV